jgi:pilus assembly protein CpaE
MLGERQTSAGGGTRVLLASTDPAVQQSASAAFANHGSITLICANAAIDQAEGKIKTDRLGGLIVDFDPSRPEEREALGRLARRVEGALPIVALTDRFDQGVARWLVQMKIGDFLVKPVATADLVRAVTRAVYGQDSERPSEAQIIAILPAAGGVGNTTLAVETAFILHEASKRAKPSTCIVDLNFQYGAVADYLDLEPRLALKEIENRPERLDRQLLEVMTAHHASGVAVIAAPNAPAEMKSFDAEVVTCLLDLVSAYFDTVVLDMPRTWFAWTDSVLIGCDKIYIVCEMTVPGIRHTQRLMRAIEERLAGEVRPQVIINRFEQRMFDAGLKGADIRRALGESLVGTVPNDYRLIREAIDRGVPLTSVKKSNNVTKALSTIVAPAKARKAAPLSPLAGIGALLARRAG